MSKSIFSTIGIVIISFICTTICNGETFILTRTDGGSDRCFLYFTTYEDGPQEQEQFVIGMAVHIRNISLDNPVCSFPWVIKAFAGDKEVGSSDEIAIEDFSQVKDLLRNNSTVRIPVRTLREFQQDCYTNPCNDFYTTVNLSFKLYSGETQIDMTCPLFDSDEFVPNSHIDVKDVRFLGCQRDDENDDDGSNWTPGSRGLDQYRNIIDQGSTAASTPKYFNAEDQLQTHISKEAFASNLRIFPNPSDQYLNIESSFMANTNLVIELFDTTGRLVNTNNSISENKYQLDLNNTKPGAYLLRIKLDDFCITKKVMVVN